MQPQSSFQTPSVSSVVTCRRPRTDWWGIVPLFALGLASLPCLVLTSKQIGGAEILLACLTTVPLLGCALNYGLLMIRGYVTADETGLRWRTIGRERSARWEEVSDYYLRPVKGRDVPYVVTPRGQFSFSDWTNRDVMKQVIADRAHNAIATDWYQRGVRPGDEWPQTFAYDSPELRWMPAAFMGALLLAPAQLFVHVPWNQFAATITMMWQFSSPAMALGFVLFTAMICLMVPALFLFVMVPRWRQARARVDERFTATPTELTWHKGASSRTVRWSEVTTYYVQSTGTVKNANLCVVETGREKIEWYGSLYNAARLAQITRHYATAADVKEWKAQEDKEAQHQARERAALSGEREFTFRTNSNRAMLWFFFAITGQPLLMFIVGHLLPVGFATPPTNNPLGVAVWLAFPLWLLWRYYAAKVVVNREGIRKFGVFGTRFIPWEELKSGEIVDVDALTHYRITGEHTQMLVHCTIDGFNDLQATVEERLAACEVEDPTAP